LSLADEGPCTEFAGKLVKQTDKAFQIDFGTGIHWIPKSQAEWAGKDTWLLTDWIAEQKELSA
jgi:hypothetical protein